MSTTADKMAIARTILQQLGGHRFVAMTGARDILALDSGLRFKLPGRNFTKQGINLVSITLDPNDTYSIQFEKLTRKGTDYTRQTVAVCFDVYADRLAHVFTATTGLDTHL